MLVGRDSERVRLAGLLECARAGRSAALVLRGEPGIGKTALLEDVKERAEGMSVLVARGVQAESGLPYAGLSELVAPVLDLLGSLPRRRRAALEGALGLAEGSGGDRFGSYAATLGLLAEAADQAPLLAVIDDAHWLDAESAAALRFSARRLVHDRTCLLFALREREGAGFDHGGLDELRLDGLDRPATAELLGARASVPVAAHVADALQRSTGGNPLALRELARLLSAGQLAGAEALPEPLPAGPNVERAFGARIAALPERTRRALVIAAAEESGQAEILAGALRLRDLDLDALADAETAELISIDAGHVAFAHPLLRSATYSQATGPARRDAHAALAASLDGSVPHRARRAWHLAAATTAPDAAVAAELDDVAADALQRAAPALAGRALEAAARVTPAGDARALRLMGAGRAHHLGGALDHAVSILAAAREETSDPLLRADIQRVRAHAESQRAAPASTRAMLLAEAACVEPNDPARAAAMRLDAAMASIMLGEPRIALQLAELAWPVAAAGGSMLRPFASLVLGAARILRGDASGGYPLVREARPLIATGELSLLGVFVAPLGMAELWVEHHDEGRRLLADAVTKVRAEGALTALPFALLGLAYGSYLLGDWPSAEGAANESLAIAEEVGQQAFLAQPMVVLALVAGAQGRFAEARAHVVRALALGRRFDVGIIITLSGWARGQTELGAGAYETAIAVLEATGRETLERGLEEPNASAWAQNLAEAYIRAGRGRDAEAILDVLEDQARRTAGRLPQAGAARCRGLLAPDGEFREHFERALACHDAVRCPFERARTELCYGERLRRGGQRVAARNPLDRALAAFDSLGAEPWAERTRRELAATGQRARKRTAATADQLTPQETQVALLVAGGASNREAAASLFVTPKTIEFHLGRIYRKLGIRSRTQLSVRLSRGDPVPGVADDD